MTDRIVDSHSTISKTTSSSPTTAPLRFTAVNRFWIGVVAFGLLTFAAVAQRPRSDPFQSPRWVISGSWWANPLEWNAPSRLAKIECGLNAIYSLPDLAHVFAAGNKGMIVASSNAGQTWTKKQINFSETKNGPSPTPTAAAASFLRLLDFTPSAQASISRSSSSAQQSPPSEAGIAVSVPRSDDHLRGIYFVDDAQRGEVVTEAGWRYFTSDGGDRWNTQFLNELFFGNAILLEAPLRSVHVPTVNDGSHYLAVTNNNWFVRGSKDTFYYPFNEDKRVYGAHEIAGIAWVVGEQGTIWRGTDGGTNWGSLQTPTPDDLHGVYFLDDRKGWVVGSNGVVYGTSDAGTTWNRRNTNTRSQLNSVHFLSDGQHGWIAGNDGLILSTTDGGETWIHQTQGLEGTGGRYLRFPAPWYFLSLFVLGAVLARRRADPVTTPPEESVADVLVSDRPLEKADGDVLAFNSIARGLSRFLRNENTLPPLTIAIIGEWGTGKSSLMNLLRVDLRSYKFRPVWFNAWHHQKEEHILASLLENIKLQAVPRWWTSRGIVFRAKLLWIRGWRQWFPLAALLFLIYVMLLYRLGNGGSDSTLATFIKDVVSSIKDPATAPSTGNIVTLIPLLAGIFTFFTAIWKGITAFGVKPASLLAGVSRGMSIRGLEAQTSFRQKFAVEFNDVTRALGERSMLIFIDDLDRCRPDQVVETLEAVNFLTTSGECFVVIGMARDYVERCVGRAFKEVAEEMIDEVGSTGKTAEEIAKRKRIEFARQYLDKLINIEVPVPAAKQSQSLALLIASTKEEEKQKLTRGQALRLSTLNTLAKYWRVGPALAGLIALLIIGYYIAQSFAGSASSGASTQTTSTIPASTQSPTQTSVPNSPAGSSPVSAQQNVANERANLVQGDRARVSPNILPALSLLILIWFGSTILTLRPGLVVRDSPRFVKALEIWHPLVFARQSTPRATKRFMNHVRYLAMRQRRQSDSEPPLQKFLCWLKEKFTGVQLMKIDPTQLEIKSVVIPDEILVALAAQEGLDQNTIRPVAPTSDFPDFPKPKNINEALYSLFADAAKAHEDEFHNWRDLEKYRDRFREMTRNVAVR